MIQVILINGAVGMMFKNVGNVTITAVGWVIADPVVILQREQLRKLKGKGNLGGLVGWQIQIEIIVVKGCGKVGKVNLITHVVQKKGNRHGKVASQIKTGFFNVFLEFF